MCARAALGYVADIEMYTVTSLLLKSLHFMVTYGKKVHKVVPQDRIYIYTYIIALTIVLKKWQNQVLAALQASS